MQHTLANRVSRFTLTDEGANQLTHALGLLLSLAAAPFLVSRFAGTDVLNTISCTVYAVTMIALFAASTLSHSFGPGELRNKFRMLDQACIFLFVAGGFTPFPAFFLRNWFGFALLAVMWTGAFCGVVARIRSGTGNVAFRWYILLGWIPIISMYSLIQSTGWAGLATVLIGGMAYTSGIYFLITDHRHRFRHAIWHICVIFGTVMHFLFYWCFGPGTAGMA